MTPKMFIANALLAFAGLVGPARAQQAEVAVTVPFEFIAGTQMLPAGKYTVSRTESLAVSPLLLRGHDGGVFLLPTTFDSTPSDKVSLSFDQIGTERVLSQINTLGGTYTIDNHREAQRLTKVAQSNDHTRANGMTPSGGQ